MRLLWILTLVLALIIVIAFQNVNGDGHPRRRKCGGIMAFNKPCVNGTDSLSSSSEPKPPKPRTEAVVRVGQGNNTKDHLAKFRKHRKHSS